MAGIEMKGLEDLKRNVEQFSKVVQDEAIQAAEDAAAKVVKTAVETASPRESGQLASSVQIFESRDRKALTGQTRRRLLIGPEKKKGFYGFFLQKGWIWSKGRRKRTAILIASLVPPQVATASRLISGFLIPLRLKHRHSRLGNQHLQL
jgi:hypothetical protein